MENIITGIDIGSNTIKLAVGQKDNDGYINIIGGVEVPSEGVAKGMISSLEDAVQSISKLVEQAERMIGIQIEHVYLGISGTHISSQNSHGVVAIAKADGEIKQDDIERALCISASCCKPK